MDEKKIYKEFTAKVIRAGAITIPSELRTVHDINENDFVKIKLIAVIKKK